MTLQILLTALQENKSLKELKLSNQVRTCNVFCGYVDIYLFLLSLQRHSVGAGIEMQMAKLISTNTSLLKFGYSFTSAGPRVLVEKYMMRNIEICEFMRINSFSLRRDICHYVHYKIITYIRRLIFGSKNVINFCQMTILTFNKFPLFKYFDVNFYLYEPDPKQDLESMAFRAWAHEWVP